MFTGTDETRGLEEWNVNMIAHLEPEKPGKPFLPCGVGQRRLAVSRLRTLPPDFRICVVYTVIITNSTNKSGTPH